MLKKEAAGWEGPAAEGNPLLHTSDLSRRIRLDIYDGRFERQGVQLVKLEREHFPPNVPTADTVAYILAQGSILDNM